MPTKPVLIGLLGLLVAGLAYVVRYDDFAFARGDQAGIATSESPAEAAAPTAAAEPSWDDADWAVFEQTARRALADGLDTVPLGQAVARIGRTFVGTAYVPHTLEPEGPERLVVNFRGLDCVTFVETAFTTARFMREPGAAERLDRRGEAEDRYERLLTELRYRGGELSGYPSRLHYFTDWITDAAAKGLVRDVTAELGGVADPEAVDFMTKHPEAYRQLREDTANIAAIRSAEERLSGAGRLYVPEERVARIAADIHDGDIIAATSTVPGLDVAHTGIAVWVDGTLRLMHAPLVGDSVQVSEETLAERIVRISGQDGVIVARPTGDAR